MANYNHYSKYKNKISENKRLYSTLNSMKARCYRKTHTKYKSYGARGIEVCEEWKNLDDGFDNFVEWALSNGYTDEMTIERIDVNGNYCPENCKWITMQEQAYNKQNTIWVNFNGEKIQLSEICKRLGVNYFRVYERIFDSGWSVEDALTMPIQDVSDFVKKCREYGIKPKTVKDRIKKLGWDEERAFITPARVCKKKPK